MKHGNLNLKLLSERVEEVERRLERLESFLRLDALLEKKRLTRNEARVLQLIANGHQTAAIATKLHLGIPALARMRAGLHQKLGTDGSIGRLILVAHQLGLVSADAVTGKE